MLKNESITKNIKNNFDLQKAFLKVIALKI